MFTINATRCINKVLHTLTNPKLKLQVFNWEKHQPLLFRSSWPGISEALFSRHINVLACIFNWISSRCKVLVQIVFSCESFYYLLYEILLSNLIAWLIDAQDATLKLSAIEHYAVLRHPLWVFTNVFSVCSELSLKIIVIVDY